MFKDVKRETLNRLLLEMNSWSDIDARRAPAFDRARADLVAEVQDLCRRRFAFLIDNKLLGVVSSDVQSLGTVVPALRKLLASSSKLSERVRMMITDVGADGELADWLSRQAEMLRAALEHLCAGVRGLADVEAVERELATTEQLVTSLQEASAKLTKARQLVAELPGRMTIAIKDQLPGLRATLFRDGVSQPWLNELDRLIEAPLRERVREQEAHRAQVENVQSLLGAADRWLNALSEGSADTERIRRDIRAAEHGQRSGGDLEACRKEAEQLLARLAQRGLQHREVRHAELSRLATLLAEAGGPQPETLVSLETAFNDAREANTPSAHTRWHSLADRAEEDLKSLAKIQSAGIEGLATRLASEARQQLDEIQGMPLTRDVRNQRQALRDEIVRLDPDGKIGRRSLTKSPLELLQDLKALYLVRERIEDLAKRAATDLARIEAEREQLQRRCAVLSHASASAGIPDANISPRLEHALDPAHAIDEIEDELRNITAALEDAEGKSIDAIRQLFITEVRRWTPAASALAEATGTEAQQAPEFPADSNPAGAATALAEARRLGATLDEQLLREVRTQSDRRDYLVTKLRDMLTQAPTPERSASIEKRLADLTFAHGPDPIITVRHLVRTCALAEAFLDMVAGAERRGRRRLEDLRARLTALAEERDLLPDLRPYQPDHLWSRVSALLSGAPDQPPDWDELLRGQLSEAGHLIDQLERQFHRHIVARLAGAVSKLESRTGEGNTPALRTLLDQLAKLRADEIPPLTLRTKIHQVLTQTGTED